LTAAAHGVHGLHFGHAVVIMASMEKSNEKLPTPKELEKEIGDFLAKRFGGNVKFVAPLVMPQELATDEAESAAPAGFTLDFDLKPEELIAYLDQYIIRQQEAKAILATKICTHFHRIQRAQQQPQRTAELAGGIKHNILMIGPTGVGKTYMIKLIAKKLGVPFVKGDATKFSETGYVGGDVEDLVRDLVREAGDNIALAEHGIVYIDEIDKIASSRNHIGADVSRTGVQRALLKPMEETEVDLKVPHDPISMLQELERFRKSGSRDRRTVNTRNILFIMSGAFGGLSEIIRKRLREQVIGFGAHIASPQPESEILRQVRAEDLVAYGFEQEFVGRLPVRAVFEELSEADLYAILKNPNNPIVLGKKLDFSAYGIDISFADEALRELAHAAFRENTGARGLVSAVERALLRFETRLPSIGTQRLPVTLAAVRDPGAALAWMEADQHQDEVAQSFHALQQQERQALQDYLEANRAALDHKHGLKLTPGRMTMVALFYTRNAMDVASAIRCIKEDYDQIKQFELRFFQSFDINIVLEDDAVDYLIEQHVAGGMEFEQLFRRLTGSLELGLKLIREKTGRSRFFLSRQALIDPEGYVSALIRSALQPAGDATLNIS
jgi:endopeptidase Clp ATP-binding regulatory subunit ClpX